MFVPDAWVWHQHPTSLWTYLARKGRYGLWRALLYLRYPEKAQGDTHTDPMLKTQFVLVGCLGLLALAGLAWPMLWIGAGILLAAFVATTLPFSRWAWRRDRAVALVWPVVTFMRVAIQGVGLAVGLIYHRLTTHERPAMGEAQDARGMPDGRKTAADR